MTNILLPVDGSSYGKVISDFMVNHRWTPKANLRLCHVIEPLADDVYPEAAWKAAAQAAAEKMINNTALKLSTLLPKSKISTKIRIGDAREEILREATDWPADLIVMGTHNHHDPHKTHIGSVALDVLGKTKATVILVRVPPQRIRDLALHSDRENLRARHKLCDTHAS